VLPLRGIERRAAALAAGARRRPLPFTVLHDERCPLCRKLQAWLARQGVG